MANPTYAMYFEDIKDVKITNLAGDAQEDLDASQEFDMELLIREGTLEGDGEIKALSSKIIGVKGKVSAGSISWEAAAILMGLTVTETGTTPSRVVSMPVNPGYQLPYIKLSGRTLGPDGDDLHILINKAKIKSYGPIAFKDGANNWVTPGFEFTGIKPATGNMVDLLGNETAAELPGTS